MQPLRHSRTLGHVLLALGVLGLLLLCLLGAALVWRLRGDHSLTTLRAPSDAIAGAYHVHSARSHDSTTSPEQWAAAAAALGLDFVVLTDHNMPHQDAVMMGPVLVLFERETSLPHGHRVDWPGAAIAAHPSDRKRPWTAPTQTLAGVEIASISRNARALGGPTLLGLLPAVLLGLVRPEAGLSQLYERDDAALALWDAAPPLTLAAGLCGADAHGWLPLQQELSLWRMVLPDLPLQRPLRPSDAQRVRDALAGGQSLCVSGLMPKQTQVNISGLTATGETVAFRPGNAGAEEAATLSALEARRPALVVHPDVPPPVLKLLHNGRVVCSTHQASCSIQTPGAGAYRAELWAAVPHFFSGHRMLPVVLGPRVWLQDKGRG